MARVVDVFADIRSRGERSLVITMSPDFYAAQLVGLGADAVHASRFPAPPYAGVVFDPDGILTPDDKPRLVAQELAALGFPAERCVAFGDSMSDAPLFRSLRHTVAVNADDHLLTSPRRRTSVTTCGRRTSSAAGSSTGPSAARQVDAVDEPADGGAVDEEPERRRRPSRGWRRGRWRRRWRGGRPTRSACLELLVVPRHVAVGVRCRRATGRGARVSCPARTPRRSAPTGRCAGSTRRGRRRGTGRAAPCTDPRRRTRRRRARRRRARRRAARGPRARATPTPTVPTRRRAAGADRSLAGDEQGRDRGERGEQRGDPERRPERARHGVGHGVHQRVAGLGHLVVAFGAALVELAGEVGHLARAAPPRWRCAAPTSPGSCR